MDKLKFSYNWNNKLGCKYYTTIRAAVEERYYLGKFFAVDLNGVHVHVAQVEDTWLKDIENLTDYDCFLDTGYNAQETKAILRKMHHLQPRQSFNLLIILLKVTNQ